MIDENIIPKFCPVRLYSGTPNAPKAIIVDLDGTLFHMNGKRGAFEWDKVDVDDIDPFVKETIDLYRAAGYKIILSSGRDSCCRVLTEKSLADNNVKYDALFMRAEGDQRPDRMAKSDIFWNNIAPFYDVKLSLDDRDQVVELYRSMGIKVYQVNPGNF